MSSRLLLIALLGLGAASLAHAAGVAFPLRRESVRPAGNSDRLGALHGFSQKLSSTHDVIYKGSIYVGTPAQKFDVVFDTGSPTFWLPQRLCKSSGPHADACKAAKRTYNPATSSSAKSLGRPFLIRYGTGAAAGRLYSDNVRFGDADGKHIEAKGVSVGAAQRIQYIDHGIIGLSLPDKSNPTPLFIEMVKQHAVDAPIFSMFMRKCDGSCEDGGRVTLGAIDEENCDAAAIHWTPVEERSSLWRFKVDGVSVGDYSDDTSYTAVADSGTSYVLAPTRVFKGIVEALNATRRGPYTSVSCDATIALELRIGTLTIALSEKELVLNQGYGTSCVLAVGDSGKFNMYLLGDAVLRSQCQIYDVEQRRVGFAPIRVQSESQQS